MFITSEGPYLALGDSYAMIFSAVGEYPFFKIPRGVILNDVIIGESLELKVVNERSIEIQGLINNPENFVIVRLSSLGEGGFKEICFDKTTSIEMDNEVDLKYVEKLKEIDRPYSGLYINSLIHDIVCKKHYSVPQAHLYIKELRRIIKEQKNGRSK